jgi:hypothetical protein
LNETVYVDAFVIAQEFRTSREMFEVRVVFAVSVVGPSQTRAVLITLPICVAAAVREVY